MHAFSAALTTLLRQLTHDIPPGAGLHVIDAALPLNDDFDPLAWLAGQPSWPQFYWQQRNSDDELAASGAVCTFPSLPQARQFLQDWPQHDDVLICGLNAFDPSDGALFLPRLVWRRADGRATLRLYLWSAHSLQEDALIASDYLHSLMPPVPLTQLSTTLISEQHYPDQQGWQALVNRALEAIERQDMDKVVLARASDLRFSQPVNAAALMAASRRVNFSCYHFYMAFSPQDAFLGSTPERLWRRIGLALRTEALAGTVENHTDDHRARALGQWLLEDDKNQRENQLVVDDICQRLEPLGNGYDILPAQVLRLRKVQHLRRCIWMTLNTPDDAQCLRQLQPTAAVAGLPREAAREFIRQHEPFSRDWYAGSAGYLSLKQTEFCVALRSARVTGDTVRLYAGAGIVAGSDPQREWQEIENKAAGLRSVLLMD